ncbi:Ig-like domain-containing protein [Solibacillus sp. FSL K6-1554]|uniref:Ig-like domain-containing protein n=1 Tax=Solibacillus sp. FSL K6-1554 TaxID=2921472 RepID=UPI0030F9B9BB
MKIYIKILVAFVLLLSINTPSINTSSKTVEAAYDYSNLSCTNEQGRDIVFVIQDTPDIQSHDPDQSRVTEVLSLMDDASSKDRFGFVGFNKEVTKELALTNNIVQAKSKLNEFGKNISPYMANDLSKGLEKAVDELTKKSTSNDKVIVIMTVGNSIYNEVSKKLAAKAYEEDITIHTISFGDPLYADAPFLTEIAKLTGGNYTHSPNAAFLKDVLSKLSIPVQNFSGREVYSDWTLTQDVVEPNGLLIHDNVKVDLNGYDLTVNGQLVMQSCSEMRAVNSVITAKDLHQQSRATIHLNNSQLNVKNELVQDGNVLVNGNYGSASIPEIKVNMYNQKIHGFLRLAGQLMEVEKDFLQEGNINFEKGRVTVQQDAVQKGYLNVQEGKLQVNGNLTINGGPLMDVAFTENKSLNVGGGVVQVGFDDGIGSTGNVKQLSGQLYVNHGTVEIFGDYTISDGWLTMIKGSMDTTSAGYGPGDGDYVRVHGNFTMASLRNHMERQYSYIGQPMNDQSHLTDGVLEVAGDFRQMGNTESHSTYSDRYQKYEKNYSKFNFNASGRHKVLLTGKGNISFASSGASFNILEVSGKYSDYTVSGPVKWKYDHLIERSVSANADLASLSINDIPVVGFDPKVKNYFNHIVQPGSFTSGVSTLKVEARADDYLNAKVEVLNNIISTDGTAKVQVLVTAHDGTTQNVYTINVKVGSGSNGQVTSVTLDREELLFTEEGTDFKPNRATLTHTVYPNNAVNQKVLWTSSNHSVVTVSPSGIVTPVGIGQASITVTTEDGNFSDSVTVKVLKQVDLLEGIKTLADLVSDNDRYNRIMNGLYDMNKIGIVVPGTYIQSINFSALGNLAVGTVKTNLAAPKVDKVEVSINGIPLLANTVTAYEEFTFLRATMSVRDYIEVIAYDATGNELERVSSSYPVNFTAGTPVVPGFYSIQRLLADPATFSLILDYYSPEQLRFAAQ